MNIILSLFFVVLSIALTKLFCIVAQNTKLMDKPNERSLHTVPTVRGGGVVFIGLFLLCIPLVCYWTQTPFKEQWVLFISVLLLALIGFFDDLYSLSAKSRFLVQCLVAGLVAVFLRPERLDLMLFSWVNPYLISVFLFIMIVWAINHFNFMDGLDGFCGSQALFLCIAYALLFHLADDVLYRDLCLILSFGLIGFLFFNFPPAKLFMGDVGSATLGFITFCMAIIAQQKYQIPIFYWFLLNILFLFDASITLLRRIINKEQWFAAHRKHAYQRLKQSGVETRYILLGQLIINGLFLIAVLLFHTRHLNLHVILLFLLGALIFIYSVIEKRFPMYQQNNAKVKL